MSVEGISERICAWLRRLSKIDSSSLTWAGWHHPAQWGYNSAGGGRWFFLFLRLQTSSSATLRQESELLVLDLGLQDLHQAVPPLALYASGPGPPACRQQNMAYPRLHHQSKPFLTMNLLSYITLYPTESVSLENPVPSFLFLNRVKLVQRCGLPPPLSQPAEDWGQHQTGRAWQDTLLLAEWFFLMVSWEPTFTPEPWLCSMLWFALKKTNSLLTVLSTLEDKGIFFFFCKIASRTLVLGTLTNICRVYWMKSKCSPSAFLAGSCRKVPEAISCLVLSPFTDLRNSPWFIWSQM